MCTVDHMRLTFGLLLCWQTNKFSSFLRHCLCSNLRLPRYAATTPTTAQSYSRYGSEIPSYQILLYKIKADDYLYSSANLQPSTCGCFLSSVVGVRVDNGNLF